MVRDTENHLKDIKDKLLDITHYLDNDSHRIDVQIEVDPNNSFLGNRGDFLIVIQADIDSSNENINFLVQRINYIDLNVFLPADLSA